VLSILKCAYPGCHRKVCTHEESLWAGLLKASSEVTEG
jgi:hypothetical protein